MKRLAAICLSLLWGAACLAADPYVGYFYPASVQAGTTNRLIVGGQALARLKGLHVGAKGFRVVKIEHVPHFPPPTTLQRRHLKNWLDRVAAGILDEPEKPHDIHLSEWRSNRWYCAIGRLDALQRSLVERFLFTPRVPLQNSPSLRQMALVTLAVDADVAPGVYGASIWNDRGISAPRPLAVTACPHAPEPLYRPPYRPRARTRVEVTEAGVVLDGQIMPGEEDVFALSLAGSRRYSVRVTAREFQPYIGDAVPGFFNPVVIVRDEKGTVLAKGDDAARFRPDPAFAFTPPVSGTYTLSIRDVLYRGRADFVYAVAVVPETMAPPPDAPPRTVVADGAAVQRFSGTVAAPGTVCACAFAVRQAGAYVLDVRAHRDGSPLDAVLTLRRYGEDASLAQWDDATNTVFVGTIPQAECDPVGRYVFAEPGRYVAEIADRTGHGGPGYFWRLDVRPAQPDFAVYSTRSTIPLNRGQPLKVTFAIDRQEGFDGPVRLQFPPDVIARNTVATAGVDRITAVLTYAGRQPIDFRSVKIIAHGTADGHVLQRDVVPCDEYEQAFAWKHLVPARAFVMRATPAKSVPKK